MTLPSTAHAHNCAHDHGGNSLAEHTAVDAICLDHVSYRYPASGAEGASSGQANGHNGWALKDITLHVEAGCNLGIIGPNGAGKSTLVKILLGLLTNYQGTVQIMGMTPAQACRRGGIVGYVSQRHEVEWRFPVNVRQVVMMGLVGKTGLFRRHRREDQDYALQMMEQVGVMPLADRPIGDLSGGQQQRTFIARALAAKPKVLILDEPMVGVDEAGQAQFADLIHALHQTLGLTVLIVSHDLQAIAAGCNRVACLNQKIHYHDAPGGLTQEVLGEVFHHDIASILKSRQNMPWLTSTHPPAPRT